MKPTYEELREKIAGLEKELADCRDRLENLVPLEEQKLKFEATLAQSPSAIVIVNEDRTLEFANRMFLQITGYSPEEITDELILSILQGKASFLQFENLQNAIRNGEVWRGEVKIARKDKQIIWLWLITFPLQHDDGKKNYVVIFNEITKQKLNDKIRQEREALYRTLVENLPLTISIFDETGKILFVNDLTAEFFNMRKEDLVGKMISDLIPGEDTRDQVSLIRQVFKSGKSINFERVIKLNGRENKFKVTRQPVFDENGKVTSVLSIAQNINEQARKEQIQKIQHQIDSLSNITSDLISSLDLVFQNLLLIKWVNCGGLYMVNYEKECLELVYHTGLSEKFIKATSNYPFTSRNALVAFNKMPRYVSVESFLPSNAELIRNEKITFIASLPLVYHDKVIGLLNLASRNASDIDDYDREAIETITLKIANIIELIITRKELDNSNNELNTKLQELNLKQQMLIQKSRLESLGELSAGLAHEINQPLSVISLVMENINYRMEQQQASVEYLSGKFTTITQNINKIRQLIDHVRIFSRDQGTIMFERIDVNKVILNALTMISSQLKNRNINISQELQKDIGFTVGNPSRFEQVILNLLSNSRDALEAKEKRSRIDGFSKEIRIRTRFEEEKIMVTLWDNGTGIPLKNVDKVFNPFFTTKPEGQATGLGLPIVYGIIREMKGDIAVKTDEGQFTEIIITLPRYSNLAEK